MINVSANLSFYNFIFTIFVLETLKLEWQCSQYLELNPTCEEGISPSRVGSIAVNYDSLDST